MRLHMYREAVRRGFTEQARYNLSRVRALAVRATGRSHVQFSNDLGRAFEYAVLSRGDDMAIRVYHADGDPTIALFGHFDVNKLAEKMLW
jgi:hypothetical protein